MTKVTQADREAAKAVYGWMGDELVQAFAAHREAAIAEGKLIGAKAMQEAVIELIEPPKNVQRPHDELNIIAIRKLNPEQIAKEAS